MGAVGTLPRAAAQEPVTAAPVQVPPEQVPPQPNPPEPAPQDAKPVSQPPAGAAPAAPAELRWEPRYHDLAATAELMSSWAARAAERGLAAEALALAATRGGRTAPALRLGRAGGRPLAERPALVLLGGFDGVSLYGGEAVLAVLQHVFDHPEELPADTALVALPWAAPDALHLTMFAGGSGRDARPLDDDGDGVLDEDGPDDVDADGQVLDMLLEASDGAWMRSSDARFVVPAQGEHGPRYRWLREGRDQDGDGRFNEDGPGGLALQASFPFRFEPEGTLEHGLTLPLEDPYARSLAELLVALAPSAVVAFQGDHGALAWPGDEFDASGEQPSVAALARLLDAARGKGSEPPRTLDALHVPLSAQSAARWMQAALGAWSLEVALWGPAVERPEGAATASPAGARLEGGDNVDPRAPAPVDRAWGRWLDDTRGGIGYVDWHPVDLGPGIKALVGGWLPFTRRNPPERSLAACVAPAPGFVLRALAALPRHELEFTEVKREGEVCSVRARVHLRGSIARPGAPRGGGARADANGANGANGAGGLTLVLPADARLLAGALREELPVLGPGARSADLRWVVLAPVGSLLTFELDCPWKARARWEIRP